MPLARARCPHCAEPLAEPPYVPLRVTCSACDLAQAVAFAADGQPASVEALVTARALLVWFAAARVAMTRGRPGIALGACTRCQAPLVLSSRERIRLPCPHCGVPIEGDASHVLVDQWPERWAHVTGGGTSLEYRIALVDDATGVTAGCAACGLATPANDPACACRRCGAVTWVERAEPSSGSGRRLQLGVRVDGARAGMPFKMLAPICLGEQMLARDAASGASMASNRSILGATGVGCAIGAALVLAPIALAIAWWLVRR